MERGVVGGEIGEVSGAGGAGLGGGCKDWLSPEWEVATSGTQL